MKVDSGFAPNPYFGYCTLAACTPNHMRAKIEPGDVIVGVEGDGLIRTRLASNSNSANQHRCPIPKLDEYVRRLEKRGRLGNPINTNEFSTFRKNRSCDNKPKKLRKSSC